MKHLKVFIGIVMLLVAASCTKSHTVDGGQVVFTVSNNQHLADMTKSNVSDFTALPSADDFTITITGSDYKWEGKISAWDPQSVLMAGDYKVTATYGDIEVEGFDKPFFAGTQSFKVVGGESASVSVPVSLGNTVVKISCSENFRNYYKDYTFTLTRDGSDIVTFVKDDTRAAFVDGYKLAIKGVLTGEVKTSVFTAEYSNLKEATAYTFNFDVNNVGGSSITISFNDTVETVELGDFELND